MTPRDCDEAEERSLPSDLRAKMALLDSEIADLDLAIEELRNRPFDSPQLFLGRLSIAALLLAGFWRVSAPSLGFAIAAVTMLVLSLVPAMRRDRQLDEANRRRSELAAERRRLLP